MIHEVYPIKMEGSQPYARLVTYIQDYSEAIGIDKRKLVLLCPGGGYAHTSDREAEAMALQFLAMGYHAAVLRYSVAPAKYPTALLEVAKSMQIIREHAEEWHVDADKIVVEGCSAGGHLAASYCMFWRKPFIAEALGIAEKDAETVLKPGGMMLCYPVITGGEFAHRGSFENLLGERESELVEEMSLEKQVSQDVPPTFIWHTFTDSAVPVENSLLLVAALRRENISTEFHMYPKGGHGLGLANELTATPDGGAYEPDCSSWISLVKTWLKNL